MDVAVATTSAEVVPVMLPLITPWMVRSEVLLFWESEWKSTLIKKGMFVNVSVAPVGTVGAWKVASSREPGPSRLPLIALRVKFPTGLLAAEPTSPDEEYA